MDALYATGWRPTPFRDYVLKVHGRCNLACDYCYVYEKADQTWRSKPASMSVSTLAATATHIRGHAQRHALPYVRVVLHGGEPLLLGPHALAQAARTLRELVAPTEVQLAIQTNGVLLTDRMLDDLLRHRVKIGVSIDGAAIDHDRHRRYSNGKGSYSAVSTALDSLSRRYRPIYSGLLATVDLDNEPHRTLEALLSFSPPTLDFLLPHANWSHPPPRQSGGSPTPYADWLIEVFDIWYSAPGPRARIRLFDDIISLILGGPSHSESVGLTPVGLVVVDTDGSIEQVDALKAAYDGAAATGLDVFSSSFDAALSHPGFVARQIGTAALSETCRRCDLHPICGGGHYAHRYRAGTGFKNPSVYCADLTQIVQHVRRRVMRDARTLAKA